MSGVQENISSNAVTKEIVVKTVTKINKQQQSIGIANSSSLNEIT